MGWKRTDVPKGVKVDSTGRPVNYKDQYSRKEFVDKMVSSKGVQGAMKLGNKVPDLYDKLFESLGEATSKIPVVGGVGGKVLSAIGTGGGAVLRFALPEAMSLGAKIGANTGYLVNTIRREGRQSRYDFGKKAEARRAKRKDQSSDSRSSQATSSKPVVNKPTSSVPKGNARAGGALGS